MDPELTKYILSLGVGGAIAALMFTFYRKDVREFTEQWKGQSEILMGVVRENTKATTSSNEIMHSILRRLEKDEYTGRRIEAHDDARRRNQ